MTSLRQHHLQYNAIISNFLFGRWHGTDAIILESFIFTSAVKPLIAISQNRCESKYIKQSETENQLK